jgi:putative DNA-invertase from lambdoid prophage Rac
MTSYGYIRVSSREQKDNYSLIIQNEALIKEGVAQENIFSEVTTGIGRSLNRTVFLQILEKVKKGDSIIVMNLDRFSRNLADGIKTISDLKKEGINLISLDLPRGQNDANDEFFRNLLLVFANFEYNRRLERQKEGIERAKVDKKYKGRVSKISIKNISEIETLIGKNIKRTQIMGCMKISNSTYYKIVEALYKGLELEVNDCLKSKKLRKKEFFFKKSRIKHTESEKEIIVRLNKLKNNCYLKEKIWYLLTLLKL